MAFEPEEDGSDADQETQARGDRGRAAPGGRPGFPGTERGQQRSLDRGDGGGLRDERLDGEIVSSLREAKIVIESWKRHHNTKRPHASLGYRPPAPEVLVPAFAAWPAPLTRPAPPAMLPVAPRPTLSSLPHQTTPWGPLTTAGSGNE